MDKLYTIGQLASIFKMDVQLLRHYDAKGLLTPAIRDSQSNYRMYTIDQFLQLATIRYLRKLNYPLKKIKKFLNERDVTETVKTLREQSEILHRQCDELIQADAIIRQKISFIESETSGLEVDNYRIKEYPERTYVQIGPESNLFTHELFYLYPTICFYKGDEKCFGTYLFTNKGNIEITDTENEFHVSNIEAGRYLCGYHLGPYQDMFSSIAKLRAYGADKKLDDQTLTVNIIDQFVESHSENYVTELQIRIFE